MRLQKIIKGLTKASNKKQLIIKKTFSFLDKNTPNIINYTPIIPYKVVYVNINT